MVKALGIDIAHSQVAVCCVDLSSKTLLHSVRLDLGECRAVSTSVLVDRLLVLLGEIVLCPDEVVIEQQSRSAPLSIALSYAAYAYYRLKGVGVTMVSADEKFTAWKKHVSLRGEEEEIPTNYHQRRRYAARLSQQVAQSLGIGAVDDHASFLLCFAA